MHQIFPRSTLRVLIVALAGAHLSPARAQPNISPEMRVQAAALAQVCRPDFNRLCSGVTPGGGRVIACLQQHADGLSPQCRDAMQNAAARKAKASAAGSPSR